MCQLLPVMQGVVPAGRPGPGPARQPGRRGPVQPQPLPLHQDRPALDCHLRRREAEGGWGTIALHY